jgi:hypothetical protein
MGEVISLWVIGLAQVGVEHILSAGCLPPAEGSTVTNTELISFTSPGFSTFSVQRPCDQRPCELASTCGSLSYALSSLPLWLGRDIFPGLPTLGAGDHVVRRANSVSLYTRSNGRSKHTSP